MDLEYLEGLIIPIITAAALCIGYVLKKWMPADDRWIPTILLIIGAVSGVVLFGFSYDGIVKGMISGIAATGFHQLFKQFLKPQIGSDELYSMGPGETEETEQGAENEQ